MADRFVKISDEDTGIVQKVLQRRLPRSAKEYNMLLNRIRTGQDIQVYTLDCDLSERAIVLLTYYRKDYGQDLNISVPLSFQPNEYVREALIATKAINWDEAYYFVSVDRLISPLVVEISIFVKKNSTQCLPHFQYSADIVDALKQDFSNLKEGIEIRSLDKIIGAQYLIDTWKYTKDGSLEYVQNVLENNPSAGVYVNGKLAGGALANVDGVIGLLYTDPAFRREGLGQLCMRYLFKEMAKIGQVPCSSAEQKNFKSCDFHGKLMTVTHETDDIMYTPFNENK